MSSALFAGACGSDNSTDPGPVPEIETTTFAPSLGITLTNFTKTSDGLYYRDVVVGTGATVATGDSLFVHYTGYFTDAIVFDSNPSTAAPFAFKVGAGGVIKGWDEGVVGMRVGGQRQLIVPPALGYGSGAHGSIPGNSILVFTITAVSKK